MKNYGFWGSNIPAIRKAPEFDNSNPTDLEGLGPRLLQPIANLKTSFLRLVGHSLWCLEPIYLGAPVIFGSNPVGY